MNLYILPRCAEQEKHGRMRASKPKSNSEWKPSTHPHGALKANRPTVSHGQDLLPEMSPADTNTDWVVGQRITSNFSSNSCSVATKPDIWHPVPHTSIQALHKTVALVDIHIYDAMNCLPSNKESRGKFLWASTTLMPE
jgi:hypothetical protein